MQDDRKSDINKDVKDDKNKEMKYQEEDFPDTVVISEEENLDDSLKDFSNSLKHQVNDALNEETMEQNQIHNQNNKKKRVKYKLLKIFGIVIAVLLIISVLMIGTKGGRDILYKLAGSYIHGNVKNPDDPEDNIDNNQNTNQSGDLPVEEPNDDPNPLNPNDGLEDTVNTKIVPRQEDYVTNYLLFGLEEIYNAKNSDTMMIASINTEDNTIKLTSLLRDTYIDLPGENPEKLNSVYAKSGANKLLEVIEQSYRIKLDGYAYINFDSFEKIVDILGGITIELGAKEADYLNKTNYISNPANRNVYAGTNLLNGNQALGYCRIRRVETLGGANDDYGRTLRQRRVLQAIFNKYKSKSIVNLLPIMSKCLGLVTTNLSQSQIEQALEDVVENRITTMNTMRVPVNGAFEAMSEYNGVDDPLVLEWDENVKELYQFIFLDTEEEAEEALLAHEK